jgi:hypothetical protein
MEITYETIIKYLVTDKQKKYFASNKHILIYSNLFPSIFNELLQNKFYRYGVTQLNSKNENISFFMSLGTLLNKDFITFDFKEEIDFYNEIINDIKLSTVDITLLEAITKLFDINLLIFDFKLEQINAVYPDEAMNPWKPTFLLANFNEQWEPIIYDINFKRSFSYNDQHIKKIYSNYKITYWKTDIINKKFELIDNVKEIIDLLKQQQEIFINKDNTDYKKKYNKMTKDELMKIIKIKNIENITIKTLKSVMIDAILALSEP